MSTGITVDLTELIGMKRFALKSPPRALGRASRSGLHDSKRRGRGMDFAEVRHYQEGDEIRHMEWRVTARTGRPHIKLYHEERERPVILLVDFNPSMYFGTRCAFKSVIAARLAALLAWTVMKQGDRIGGFLFSTATHHEFMPLGRQHGVLPILAALSQYTQFSSQSETIRPLSDALLRVRRVVKPGSMLVIISDFYSMDKDSESQLSRLRSHNDVLAYHLCDPLELAAPPPARYAMTDLHQNVLLDTTVLEESRAYQQYCEQRMTILQGIMTRLRIQRVQVKTTDDLSRLVISSFTGSAHG